MLRKVMSLFALVIALYLLCLALMWARQDTLIFPGFLNTTTVSYGPSVQRLWLTAADGTKLHAWYRPASHTASPNAARTLLYFGGNAEDVTSRLSHPELFEGWNLILVDYRGYGQSQGRATQASLEKDALAWAQAAAGNVPEVPLPRPTQLAVMGTSLGSYYASFVATHQKVDRLILATPYDTIVSVAQGHYPWIPVKWLLRHPHNTLGLVEKIRVPTLFIAAEKDTTVPVLHAQRLHQAWRGPERVWLQVPNVNHNEVTDTPAYREAVQKFLNNSF